jgi:virginiamycin B lyase
MPSGKQSRPYAVTVDSEDRIWLVETGVSPNQFVGFDTSTEEFIGSTSIESGGGTVRHMVFHEPTNAIWFGTDTNYLGRAKIQ